jgi:zinc transport system substrate-binding protein
MIVSHKAYGHLAEAYGIEQIGLQGLSNEGESTPRYVAQIVDKMTELGSRHLLQEPIAGTALAEMVAAESGSEILPLHPMESLTPAELDGGATYFTIMDENLRSLRVALGCS